MTLQAFLTAGAIRGGIILAGILLAQPLLRRSGAALRHASVLAGLLLLPGIPLLERAVPVRASGLLPAPAAEPVLRIEAAVQRAAGLPRSAPDAPSPGPAILVIIWIAGVVVSLGWLAAGRLRMRRFRRGATLQSGPTAELVRDTARELGERRPVTLLTSSQCAVPVTWGTIYPVILVPDAALQWPAERWRMVLLHELGHVRRRDVFWLTCGGLVAAVFWFQPLVWIALRALRASAERAADDWVVRGGVRPSVYVSALVEMVQAAPVTERLTTGSFAMARRAEFEGRMFAVLDEGMSRGPVRGRGLAVAALLAGVAIPLAAMAQPALLSPAAAAPQSGVDVLLGTAGRYPANSERASRLTSLVQGNTLAPAQIDRYLELLAPVAGTIARGSALEALARACVLSPSQIARALEIAAGLQQDVPRAGALMALAQRQRVEAANRVRYLQIANTISNPTAFRSAVDALR